MLDTLTVAEAQPEQVLKTDSRFTLAHNTDIPFVLVRAQPAARENVTIRYTVYVRAETNSVQLAAAAGTSLRYECRWRLNGQLLRQFCFQSITRQAACTQTVVIDLPQTESGSAALTAETLDSCTATGSAVADPVRTYAVELQKRAAALEEEDLTEEVVPQLRRTGLAVQRVTPPKR